MKLFHKKENTLTKLRQDHYKGVVAKQAHDEKEEHLPNHEGAYVCLNNVQKIYPNGYYSVVDFNLDIKQGEFVVLVGPSGCGKTTTLRMICGLESITAGALYIDGNYSNDLEPKDRGISMVFQNYALFPHLSVYDNLAYGLKVKKIVAPLLDKEGKQVVGIDKKAIKELEKEKKWYLKNDPENKKVIEDIDHDILEYRNNEIPLTKKRKLTKQEIDEKINKAASILNLEQLLKRKPSQLSGGQCQRVALGRVLVSDAKLLLMDEPLSNLDAKLRVTMRSEIIRLHKALNATTIYVTHDQVEAMTMADKIVIMDRAHIKQVGTPSEVYENPNCLFVASFIGSPSMNISDVSYKNGSIYSGEVKLKEISELDGKLKDFYQKMLEKEEEKQSKLSESFTGELLEDEMKLSKERIDKIKEILDTQGYPLKFGIRPERISVDENGEIEGKIISYELLGERYHVNIVIGASTMMVNLPNDYSFHVGDKLKVDFGKDYFIFDSLSGDRII